MIKKRARGRTAALGRTADGVGIAVLAGLREVELSDREAAAIAGVSPATVADWHAGAVPVPAESLVLLTLVLAHLVEELAALDREWAVARFSWHLRFRERLESAWRHLAAQEAATAALPEDAVRRGHEMFREWWGGRRASAAGIDGTVAGEASERRVLGAA